MKEELNIYGKKVVAEKLIYTIRHRESAVREKKIAEKIVYVIPMDIELYKKIPNNTFNLNEKTFYKADINAIDQKYFRLIEY